MFIDTAHEEYWLFYHDALSLMTAQESIEYMKKGIMKDGYYLNMTYFQMIWKDIEEGLWEIHRNFANSIVP